jgi:HSP20 family protein
MSNEIWKISSVSLPHFEAFPISRILSLPSHLIMPNPNRKVALLTVAHRVRPSGRLWNPAADVYRSEDGWIVKVDLAGICADDLELEIDQSSLRIRGRRRDTFYREGLTYQQMEITYSRFEKTIEFPFSIEAASLAHDYHDGFLVVSLRCQ